MKVRDIMQADVHFLHKGDSLRSAAALFKQHRALGAQVLDEQGFPEAVFTSDDLIRALAGGADLSDPVSHFVHGHICAVHPDTQVEDIPWYESRFLVVYDGIRIVGCVDATRVPAETPQHACGDGPGMDALRQFPEPLLLLDAGGRIRWWNDAARIVCRGEGQELGGRPLADALEQAGFMLEPDPAEPDAIALAVRDDCRYMVARWMAPGLWSDGAGASFMAHMRDVHDQHAVLRKLSSMRALSRELHAIIDSSFDGIFITDGEGRTLRVNRAYERITGIRSKEVLGRTMSELVAEGFYDESVTLRVLESRKSETIIQKVKSGKTVVVTGNPIMDEEGNVWRVVTNVRDVTELRRLQQELEKMSALQTRYRLELDSLRRSMGEGSRVVVRSKKMREVYDQALRLAQVDSTVLILGESGVGKEVVAEIIHENSPRRDRPFVKMSCAAIPEQLLESELFGYAQGAFTGASKTGKPGVFELAHQGALFLDEIGELPMALQVKLLRALQERTVMRLGEVRATPVDVRIMAATNRDLEAMMQAGQFRSDLFYRLNVVPILVPPLRERREAIFDFIYRFLERFNRKYGLGRQIDPDACDILAAQDWPGNVRQLENTVERLVVLARGDVITRDDAWKAVAPSSGAPCDCHGADQSLNAVLEEAERSAIRRALELHTSTRAAARALGVNQSTVVRKARRYGLSPR